MCANMRTFCLYMRYNTYIKINSSPQNVSLLNSGDKYKKYVQFSWRHVSTILIVKSDLENEENTFNYPIHSKDSTVTRIYWENEGIHVYSHENTTEPYENMTNLSEHDNGENETISLKSFENDTEITSEAYGNESSVKEPGFEEEASISTTYFRDDSGDFTLTETAEGLENMTTDI
ncbi:hypothetical protein WA026_000040 [Henosepilachna vigintioctopunctata]|uniref:Uncharacterized protein n=1 Tax=Henosepilachna vigintioctopunctata TaxID=420089 RepID=A0AAW1V3W3_9CUCU